MYDLYDSYDLYDTVQHDQLRTRLPSDVDGGHCVDLVLGVLQSKIHLCSDHRGMIFSKGLLDVFSSSTYFLTLGARVLAHW